MTKNLTCVVTIHGIGFEQPPDDKVANSGYADPLHLRLKEELKDLLSDDPGRKHNGVPGENGAIYVGSCWREHGQETVENGLRRLGCWKADGISVDGDGAPLVSKDEQVSHIALVYYNLESDRGNSEAARLLTRMSLFSRRRYGRLGKLLSMSLLDGWAIVRHAADRDPANGLVSTRPRRDQHRRSFAFLDSLRSTIQNIKDDVACYVCFNNERERVRSFVAEALTRLAYRDDVENIILNMHSNGTVVGFDVVRHLSPEVVQKIKAFVTAGSPLRKYVDLFSWGHEVLTGYSFEPWYNFLDKRDPVVDPLEPPITWRVGEQGKQLNSNGSLFSRVDLNKETPDQIQIADLPINNVKWSVGGGLRAHNYWDNAEQFVPQLSEIIRATVAHQQAKIVSMGRRKQVALSSW